MGSQTQVNKNFPAGNVAYQERYIEAFRGLTQVIASGAGGSKVAGLLAVWDEMFNTLIATGEKDNNDDDTE